MAKPTFSDFSTVASNNTDINGIGIQGTNAVSNFDGAFRELMAILRRDVPGLTTDNSMSGINTHTKIVKWAKGADVASASALTLGDDGNYFDITGTTAITSIATKGVGTVVMLQFDAALTLTHNATDLVLPNGVNIVTSAGDHAMFVEYATGDWRLIDYQSAKEGEFVSSFVLEGSAVSFTSGAAQNITSITLSAGDWDVEGTAATSPAVGTTTTGTTFAISLTSASLEVPSSSGWSEARTTSTTSAGGRVVLPLSRRRVNVTTTTTVYLVGGASFSGGTLGGYGAITARRVR